MQKSRQRKKIYAAAASLGIEIAALEWESIFGGPCKEGSSGGWYLKDTDGNVYLGYNVDELIADMKVR